MTQDDNDAVMGRLVRGPQAMQKKDSWSQLRASLDMDNINPAVVHPEDHFEKLQMAADDKQKRGYNPLKVSCHSLNFWHLDGHVVRTKYNFTLMNFPKSCSLRCP